LHEKLLSNKQTTTTSTATTPTKVQTELDQKLKKNQHHLALYDIVWLIVFIVYLIGFLVLPALITLANNLPPASAMTLIMEQIRMLMKTIAFVRSNVPRALLNGNNRISLLDSKLNSDETKGEDCVNKTKLKSSIIDSFQALEHSEGEDEETETSEDCTNTNEILCPSFTCYLYFLFAPTLVYKDKYPRTRTIRWNVVFSNFAQVIGCGLYTYYIFWRFCIPVFKNFNTEHVTVKMFISSILNCTLPGTLLLLVGFYAFLHCWLNAFSEMLRFGDRMFYKDWWNSTNYSNYYRSWNVVVHDWLYSYIYKDAYYLLGKKHKWTCQFLIFLISAAIHEYVITLAFGFFYPVLFCMFGGLGFGFLFLKSEKNPNFWNFVMWISLLIGLGGLMCLYSIEWYARQNCSQSFDSIFIDYMLPRSFTCGMGKSIEIKPI
jgi:sterol O-acyltransferase